MGSRLAKATVAGSALSVVRTSSESHMAAARFGAVDGVVATRVGFTGGSKSNPTYRSLGDHTESIQLQFDPSKISYNELLDMFWNNHDCTSARSKQYMSAIFYHSEEQQEKALASRDIFQTTQSRKIVTRIDEAQTFYNAEDYHQKYILRQNPSVLAELNLSDAELITSHVAARLNGYLGGHGTQKQLQEELDEFSLSNKVKEKIRAKVGAKQSGL